MRDGQTYIRTLIRQTHQDINQTNKEQTVRDGQTHQDINQTDKEQTVRDRPTPGH